METVIDISEPITISSPGTYKIPCSEWSPSNYQTAITIASDDVTLIGSAIKQISTADNCTFIFVGNYKNIIIKNLFLKNITGCCIFSIAENLTIQNIKCYGCGVSSNHVKLDTKDASPTEISANFLLSGDVISISNCGFVDIGSVKSENSTSIYVFHTKNLYMREIVVKGCVAKTISYGLTLISIDKIDGDNIIVTDLKAKTVKGIYTYDAAGNIKNFGEGKERSSFP
jgi:hypothetical protein